MNIQIFVRRVAELLRDLTAKKITLEEYLDHVTILNISLIYGVEQQKLELV